MSNKNLNIAVIISTGMDSGGAYQYEYKVLDLLNKYHRDKKISIHYYASNNKIIKDYSDLYLNIKLLKENFFQKLHRLLLPNIFLHKIGLGYSSIEKKLKADNIDLIYFLSQDIKSQAFSDIPYIFTLWDIGHLDIMEFPEINFGGKFEFREATNARTLKKAIKVIVTLDYSKKDVIKRYNLDEKRVEVLEFLPNIRTTKPNKSVSIREKYKLKNDFIFYPAQFWAHKNHIYILEAIKILRKEKATDIDVVFSGSNKGNLEYILDKAKEFKIEDLVHYIGFVSNDEIPLLYDQSLALVMPTYLGPTNIPPLEAFAYETPVCYSDTPFFREQVGDAAFFMNLKDPNSLVQNLLTILNDHKLTDHKVVQGKKIIENWDDKDFYNKLLKIFRDYKYIRRTWK